MMTKPYQPIPCSLHDEYEIAIMHKKTLHIKWMDDADISRTALALPKDIIVKKREEFLVVDVGGDKSDCIRLDEITLLE